MTRDLSMAHTCVFWDVEDCPVPDGHDPDSVNQIIKSALKNKGYDGKVNIIEFRGYGEKNKIRDEFLLAGIKFIPEGDKCARVNRMMIEVLFWALDNRVQQSVLRNVMVISKNISEDWEFLNVLNGLQSRDYKVLLVDSDNVASLKQHDFISSVWLWKSLLDEENTIDQSVNNKLKRKERTTATCSGSSEGVAKKQGRKKRKSKKPHEAKSMRTSSGQK